MTCAYITTVLLLNMSEYMSSTLDILKSILLYFLDMYGYASTVAILGYHGANLSLC